MRCPICRKASDVVDSRPQKDGRVLRRRLCLNEHRFKTFEDVERPVDQKLLSEARRAVSGARAALAIIEAPMKRARRESTDA